MIFSQIDIIDDQIRVFRDDLFPFLGGGNKGRKILFIEKDIKQRGCNAVVSTGGVQSNHCRAVAILAAQNHWPCTLILHGDKERLYSESGNARIIKTSGANVIFVNDASEISECMDNAMNLYSKKNLNPYYIQGGGHTIDGGLAYIDAVRELEQYSISNNWFPEYIFLASGTGSTQAGLLAGVGKYKIPSKVIGISVAREKHRAEENINNFYTKLCLAFDIKHLKNDIIVLDDYLCGGYEKYNSELKKLSLDSVRKYGFTLDTTYTGKAFYGMLDYIKQNNINSNILFWHTGGIFNFLM
ncbi:MAG: pyridoxal-phosphate dependent enzyme [Dysgonomonas mossii]|nr:pyridoxal-phosphate dependent enzyme [Dysgonomonas mossii]